MDDVSGEGHGRRERDSAARPDETGVRGELSRDSQVGNAELTRWHTRLGRMLVRLVLRVSAVIGPHGGLVLILFVGALIAGAATFLAARVYDAVTEADGLAVLDQPVLDQMVRLRSPALNAAATVYTDIGGVIVMPILAVVAVALLTLYRRSWTPAIIIVGSALGSLLMTIAGKDILARVRPPIMDAVPPFETSPSFPSGHTLNATVIAGAIAYTLVLRQSSRTARTLTIGIAALFALLIGASRVYLGHHWLTDVIGAWLLGIAWLAAVITAHRLYLTTRRRQRSAAHV